MFKYMYGAMEDRRDIGRVNIERWEKGELIELYVFLCLFVALERGDDVGHR